MAAAPLPRLRMNLDFLPSPVEDRPGLLVRDPFHYTDVTSIIPPALVECLQYFDGAHTREDLAAHLRKLTGEFLVDEPLDHLLASLGESGYLEDENYAARRAERHAEFAAAPRRTPAHAGSGYPAEAVELRTVLDGWFAEPAAAETGGSVEPAAAGGRLRALAAPHVSPIGGWRSYTAAYRPLVTADAERTIVLLGTSHYGPPQRFGLTRKPFVTPYGTTRTALEHVEALALAGKDAVEMEDYCHAVEHSIEFQVVFLQHLLGPDLRIVPVLCGSFLESILDGGRPEDDPGVRRVFEALTEMAADPDLLFVLGVDMAHMGRRYGDEFPAVAAQGEMEDVVARDHARIDRLNAGDADGFWKLVQENHDDLKWCGSAPFYTLARCVPGLTGTLRSYEQWNIDAQSVVSFAGIEFRG